MNALPVERINRHKNFIKKVKKFLKKGLTTKTLYAIM